MFWITLVLYAMSGTVTQTTQPTDADTRMASYAERVKREQASPLTNLEYTSIGPRVMGGRVVSLQSFADNPQVIFSGYASGGLWRSDDGGITARPLFDQTPSITIGDFAVNPKNLDEIWLGTGEENASRSSYAGTGLYHTTDGGKTWKNVGLAETHRISKIIIHPDDPKTVYVSAIGPLYAAKSNDRGVYKTTDGGKTWDHILKFDDGVTGVIDMAMDPTDADRIYAAAWEKGRKAWNFIESGPGSGMYITEDGGANWTRSDEGLPVGDNLGRIAISISPADPKVVYLYVDNQDLRETEPETAPLTQTKLRDMTQEAFLELDDRVIERFLRGNRFHREITAKSLRAQMKAGTATIDDVRNYIRSAAAELGRRDYHGIQLYRSDNHGKSWRKTHDEPIEGFTITYGYYFGTVTADPNNVDRVYLGGVFMVRSDDGGKTFRPAQTPNVHVDYHAIWINPTDSEHIICGQDGGIAISHDGGDNWIVNNNLPVGQFYTVAYDMAKPTYNVYGGLQDNGVWFGPAREQHDYSQPWRRIGGGDGAFVQVDFRDNATVYLGLQFGNYFRVNTQTGARKVYQPRHRLKEDPVRYNWMTPIVLSRHHQDIFYMGAQRVFRSLDKAETFEPISPDLTTNPTGRGDVPYATITMLRESPHSFGTLYAGTDDGRLWVTRGAEWTEISGDVTKGLWVSGIDISPHQAGEVFVSMTGYRNDDFTTHIYHSTDYGQNWASIKGDMPEEPVNVIRQDPKNPDVLYVGTDVGLWITFDKGKTWHPHQAGLPNVPVYAMEIHPREHELIAATHGRSIYTLPLAVMSQIKPDVLSDDFHRFTSAKETRFSERWGSRPFAFRYNPPPPAHQAFAFYTKDEREATLSVYRGDTLIYRAKNTDRGVRHLKWDYRINQKDAQVDDDKLVHKGQNEQHYAKAGDYRIDIQVGDETLSSDFKIKAGR